MSLRSSAPLVVLLTLLLAHVASAVCPSNGNLHALYCTTNLGDSINAFDTDGHLLGDILNKDSFPANLTLDKLRAMQFGPDGLLYVASARGMYSAIIALRGNGLLNHSLNADCTRGFAYLLTKVDGKTNPHLDHPYSFFFHPKDGSVFVANQNSVTITRYFGPHSDAVRKNPRMLGQTLPWSPAMVADAKNQSASAAADAASPAWAVHVGGVFAAGWSSPSTLNSVRGMALSPPMPIGLAEGTVDPGIFNIPERELAYYVLVCDVVGNRIAVFDPETGKLLWAMAVPSPIQIMFTEASFARLPGSAFKHGKFYATSKTGAVFRGTFARGHENIVPITPMSRESSATSGIVEIASHATLLVADRYAKTIFTYGVTDAVGEEHRTSSGGVATAGSRKRPASREAQYLGPFHAALGAQPEFLLMVQLESQGAMPYCTELRPDGSLRTAALCRAVSLWKLMALAAVVLAVLQCFRQSIVRSSRDVSEKAMRRKMMTLEEDEEEAMAIQQQLQPASQSKHYGST